MVLVKSCFQKGEMKRTLLLLCLLCPALVFANETRPPTGYTGAVRFNEFSTACVECHHTEQPSSAIKPYLKRFDRKEILTAEQLERSKEPVRSCRACHYQKATTPTAEFPPKSVKYPKEVAKVIGDTESGELNNEAAYHLRCVTCHTVAMDRRDKDPKLKAPTGCPDCHIKKGAAPSP